MPYEPREKCTVRENIEPQLQADVAARLWGCGMNAKSALRADPKLKVCSYVFEGSSPPPIARIAPQRRAGATTLRAKIRYARGALDSSSHQWNGGCRLSP